MAPPPSPARPARDLAEEAPGHPSAAEQPARGLAGPGTGGQVEDPPPAPAVLARRIVLGICALAVVGQLVGLLLWSQHLVDSASLTWDFSIYFQPWYLIAHGHLLPRDTLQGGYYFFQNDAEFIVYLLAPLYWLFPDHHVGYLWLQDLAVAGASAVVVQWATRIVPWRPGDPLRRQLAAALSWLLVTSLLVLNPWVYWTTSFDIHMEPFGVLFALLALRALIAGRRSGYVLLALTVLCGVAASLFAVGVALTALIVRWWGARRGTDGPLGSLLAATGRGNRAAPTATSAPATAPAAPGPATARTPFWRRRDLLGPAVATVCSLLWMPLVGALNMTQGSVANGYRYLVHGLKPGKRPTTAQVVLGILEHPGTAEHVIATHGWNLWANLSPGGLVGFFTVPGFLLSAPTMLINNLLKSQGFSYPSFQNYVVYVGVALGTLTVVGWLLRRRWLVLAGVLLAGVMVANVVAWFWIWLPTTASRWVRTDPPGAALVTELSARIPARDEVVASQGMMGLLAGRPGIYGFTNPMTIPVRSKTVWFVLSTYEGIETATPAQTMMAVETVSRLPGVVELPGAGTIYLFRWHATPGIRSIRLGAAGSAFPAWAGFGPAGTPVTVGPMAGWYVRSTGPAGPLIENDVFQGVRPGPWVGKVRYTSSVPLTVAVVDTSTATVLSSATMPPSSKPATFSLAATVPSLGRPVEVPAGNGLYRFDQIPPSPDPNVEVAVNTPGGGQVAIPWVELVRGSR